MGKRLSVPFHAQIDTGYCLAACAQMVLAYQGLNVTQEHLARLLSVKPGLGTPTFQIKRLTELSIKVIYEEGDLDTLQKWVRQNYPVIVFVQAGELSHWSGEFFQHAIVVIEVEPDVIWSLDPDMSAEPVSVTVDEFLLAWMEMDYLYAVLDVA